MSIQLNTATPNPVFQQSYVAVQNTASKVSAAEKDICPQIAAPSHTFDDFKAMSEKSRSHYQKVNEENKLQSDPRRYIRDKYLMPNSKHYRSDMTEKERKIAYRNEIMMYETGMCPTEVQDYIFRDETKNYFVMEAKAKQLDRDDVNASLNGILQNAGIEIPKGQSVTLTIDPYAYKMKVGGLDDKALIKLLENTLNEGQNGSRLYRHILSSATADSSQVSYEKRLKYDLFHSILNTTGYDIRTLENRNGVLLTPDGQDVVNLYRDKAPMDDQYRDYAAADLRSRITKMLETGWDNIDNMILSIEYKDGYLYDIGQKYGYGPEQPKEGL